MASERETVYQAAMAVIRGKVVEDVAVVVGPEGRVKEVLEEEEGKRVTDASQRVVDLGEAALIPGQINIHSHAFQRSMRGRTEYRGDGASGDDFWSWRREMYAWAHRLSPEQMGVVGRMAFMEMARAGITHVGEFHYLHHREDGQLYDRPLEMAYQLVEAARDVGIRMTMMPVAYETGDINRPPMESQRRFIAPDLESYLGWAQELEEAFAGESLVATGVAPHSIRAVSRPWLEAIASEARARGWPLHIHACEQRKEVERSKEEYGMAPIEAFEEWGVLDKGWTLIHGTHLEERELEILEEVKPTIGACPTTERNLGDGFLEARKLVSRGVPIALGSDSHTVIDPFEEMRLVEYHERLRVEERNVLAAHSPEGEDETASVLWPMGTTNGARSLKAEEAGLEVGAKADFVALDLRHPSLVGTGTQTLLSDVVLSMSAGAVQEVVVDGKSVVAEGRHRREKGIVDAFRALMERFQRDDERQ